MDHDMKYAIEGDVEYKMYYVTYMVNLGEGKSTKLVAVFIETNKLGPGTGHYWQTAKENYSTVTNCPGPKPEKYPGFYKKVYIAEVPRSVFSNAQFQDHVRSLATKLNDGSITDDLRERLAKLGAKSVSIASK